MLCVTLRITPPLRRFSSLSPLSNKDDHHRAPTASCARQGVSPVRTDRRSRSAICRRRGGYERAQLTRALNAAFVASVRGDWDATGEVLRGLVEEDDANYVVRSAIHPSIHHNVAEGGVSVTFVFSFDWPLITWSSLFLARES
jgi:hypothetical protein